jgi:hypothetical protein
MFPLFELVAAFSFAFRTRATYQLEADTAAKYKANPVPIEKTLPFEQIGIERTVLK